MPQPQLLVNQAKRFIDGFMLFRRRGDIWKHQQLQCVIFFAPDDTQLIAGPTAFASAAGNIPAGTTGYNQAVAGPNVGGSNAAGFTPLSFNPTENGIYYIELGYTTPGNTQLYIPYFISSFWMDSSAEI